MSKRPERTDEVAKHSCYVWGSRERRVDVAKLVSDFAQRSMATGKGEKPYNVQYLLDPVQGVAIVSILVRRLVRKGERFPKGFDNSRPDPADDIKVKPQ